MHLAHNTHTVILDQIGYGNFPGHFQKRKIMSLTPVDNFLGDLFQIHSRIDDNSGAFRIFHGGNQAQQPAFIAGFHSGGDGEFFSAEPVDYRFVLQHMNPAGNIIHPVFSRQNPQLIFFFCLFINFPESDRHNNPSFLCLCIGSTYFSCFFQASRL